MRWALVFVSILSSVLCSITAVHSEPQPSPELIIQKLLENAVSQNSLEDESTVVSIDPSFVETRVDLLLKNSIFKETTGEQLLNSTGGTAYKDFVLKMTKRVSPYPISHEGKLITHSELNDHPDGLLNKKIDQVVGALKHVVSQCALCKRPPSSGFRLTVAEANLPILGVWLYSYLVALLAAHPGYEDSNIYGKKEESDTKRLLYSLSFAGANFLSAAIFFQFIVKLTSVESSELFLYIFFGHMVASPGLALWFLSGRAYEKFDPNYDYAADLKKSYYNESALLNKSLNKTRAALFAADGSLRNNHDLIEYFFSTASNAGSDASRFLNQVIVFENGDCAKNLRKGKEIAFVEDASN